MKPWSSFTRLCVPLLVAALFAVLMPSADAQNGDATIAGDTSCNGVISIADAVLVAQYIVGNRTASQTCPLADPASEINVVAADTNNDGRVSIADAVTIAQCLVQVPNVLCPADGLTLGPPANLAPVDFDNQPAAYPLTTSGNGELLIDQNGVPFQVNGDAAWSLLAQLDLAETDEYLALRSQQGINTLVVNLIESRFSDNPPNNAFGQPPFLAPGDFSQPNPAYFAAARSALQRMADAGFLVLLTPAYLGFNGGNQGWYQSMVAAGPEELRQYGRFVGDQFGDLDNVIWVHGGDFTIPADDLDLVEAIRQGIVESGSTQLHTAHWSPETSGSDVNVDWLDLNTTYTYQSVHTASLENDGIAGLAHVLFESRYEDDIFGQVSPQRLRSHPFEAALTGAIGSIYGHGDIWQFTTNWRASMNAPGVFDMTHAAGFFQSIEWVNLEPTAAGQIIADRGQPDTDTYISLAHSADRSVIAAYVPAAQALQLDLSAYSGTVVATWFDPADGSWVPATSRLTNGDQLEVDAPGQNSDGDLDWALYVRVDG